MDVVGRLNPMTTSRGPRTGMSHVATVLASAALALGLGSCSDVRRIPAGSPLSQQAIDATNAQLRAACHGSGEDCDVPPQLVSGRAAEYPQEERVERMTGRVVILLVVHRNGSTSGFEVESANDSGFARAALSAVKTWIYRPASSDGHPVELKVRQEIDFQL